MNGGAFRGMTARPWHRSVVAELLARPRVPAAELLEHVPLAGTRPGCSRSHREADQRRALERMLWRLARLGATDMPGCLHCGQVIVRDRLILERLATHQAMTRLAGSAPAAPAEADDGDGGQLRLITGGAA